MASLRKPTSVERFLTYRLFILCAVLFHSGCVRRETTAPAPRLVAAQPDLPSQTYTCMQEVLQLPAIDVATVNDDGQHGANETFPINTLLDIATDGERYSLHVNAVTQSAFITSAGGIGDHLRHTYGPWPTTSPQVATLIRLVCGSNDSENAPIPTQ